MKQNKFAKVLSLSLVSFLSAQAVAAVPPFYPVTIQKIPVPEKVYPWLPTYTPDGKHILFQNQLDGNLWLSAVDTNQLNCITCNMQFPERFDSGFTYVLPDMKSVFISKRELAVTTEISDDKTTYDAYVMECDNTITDCKTAKFYPVDLSDDKAGTYPPVQRRTWHLSPDGKTLAWTVVRQDGSAVIAGQLTKEDKKYRVTDTKVITPIGPYGKQSSERDKVDYASQLWELKSFADGGKSAIMLTQLGQNVDSMKVDLKTGTMTRLTANLDWDEDGAISPDGDLYTLYSWRTRHRLDATSIFPQLNGFMGFPLMRIVLQYYINQYPGFQCDLSPWLLPAKGDAAGELIGQPLQTYEKDGNIVPGNNLAGFPFWSPDSTSVLLQGRNRQPVPPEVSDGQNMKQKGMMDNEIVVAHIAREPGKKIAFTPTIIGDWAPAVADWKGYFNGPVKTHHFAGKHSGTVTVSYMGKRGVRDGNINVIYENFTDDGKTFLNGEMSARMGVLAQGEPSTIKINIKLTGEHSGSMIADMSDGKGTWETIYDGKKAPSLPAIGPCYDNLPGKTPLQVSTQIVKGKLKVKVTATIAGDSRPVQNATVAFANKKVKTDLKGVAYLPTGSKFTVTAGDTFSAPAETN